MQIISRLENEEGHFGIYNYCNEGETTWYDFAKEIAALLGIESDITPVSSAEYGARASRPPYSVLDTTKISRTFGIPIPHWKKGLTEVLRLAGF
jgi:dTDP-4-dehydrorhamnose reductase